MGFPAGSDGKESACNEEDLGSIPGLLRFPGGRHFRSRDRLKTRPLASVGFPDSSAGKESACSAGDPGSIPGSRRPPGEGKGYPHQYSWAPLVAQLVKNPPAMQDTWVQSLGQEDPPEKGKATHSSIPAWRTPWTVLSMGWQRVRHD